jgi:hypothetical protein
VLLPKSPHLNVDGIYRRKAELYARLLEYVDKVLTADDVDSIAVDFLRICKLSFKNKHMKKSLQSLVGRKLTKDGSNGAKEIAWRIAGNTSKLKNKPVFSWTLQAEMEWVSIEIVDVKPVKKNTKGKQIIEIVCRVNSGSPAGMHFIRKFPLKFMPLFAGQLGFDRKEKWKLSIRELVRMRFRALLLPDMSNCNIKFEDFKVQPSDRTTNKHIITFRKLKCPRGKLCPCYECPVSYFDCPGGCRPATIGEDDDSSS